MRPPRTRRQALLARTALAALLLAAVGLASYAVVLAEQQPAPSTGQAIVPPALRHGAKAPTFSLARLGGGPPVTYSAPTGQPVVVQFFASWCQDCRADLGSFANAWRTLGKQVRFIGVDDNDSKPAEAEQLLRAAGGGYPTGVDPYALIANRYELPGLPATIFINPAGHVVEVAIGTMTTASVEHWASVAGAKAGGAVS